MEVSAVYMAVAIDAHSSYGTAVLAPARNGEMAAAALDRLHRERSAEGVTEIGRAVTDNGTEFKGTPTYPFEAFCAHLGARHRFTKFRNQRQGATVHLGTPRGYRRGPTSGRGRVPADQIRSKLRTSSQSVTARVKAAHSWRAVLSRCSCTSGPNAAAATALSSNSAMASGRVAGMRGASVVE